MTSKSHSTKSQQERQATDGNPALFLVIRKRTVFICAVAIAIAVCATVEWIGQYGYNQSIVRLQFLSNNGEKVVTLATVREKFAAGFPVEHVVKVGGKTVSLLWWPSLFDDRKVLLYLTDATDDSVVTSFGTPDAELGGQNKDLLPPLIHRHTHLYRYGFPGTEYGIPGAKYMLRREDVQAELQLSTNQIAEVKKHHYYLVPEILTEIQHKRLSQLALQTLDLEPVMLET